jgi:amino acid transporter
VIFAAFALTAGLLARGRQERSGHVTLFFSSQFHLMTWLSMVALGLACCQLLTAAWIFRKLPWPRPPRIREIHRWTGRLAIVFVLPVLYWCIFQLGFQTINGRYLAHSVLGTLFVGAVAGKITIVRLRRFPAWVYLLAGLLVFATLLGAWSTSALWFVHQAGNPLF